nr:LysR family transcriptional regulator [Leucobacter chinensis]
MLSCFEAVARLGSLSAASAELHVTQPALSRQLKELERTTGVELFDRSGYRLTLTRAGRDFLPHTRKVLLATAQLEEVVRTQVASPESQLVIACPPETARHIIAPLIAEGKVATARIVTAPADEVLEMLREGACDIAIGTAVPPQELSHTVLGTIPLTAQFTEATGDLLADHGVGEAGARHLDVRVLEWAPVVAVEHYRGVRGAVEVACVADGVAPRFGRVFSLPEVAQAYAAKHGGLCMLSGEPALFGLTSKPLSWRGRELRIPLHAAWIAGAALDVHIRRVVAQLSESGTLDAPEAVWPAPAAEGGNVSAPVASD